MTAYLLTRFHALSITTPCQDVGVYCAVGLWWLTGYCDNTFTKDNHHAYLKSYLVEFFPVPPGPWVQVPLVGNHSSNVFSLNNNRDKGSLVCVLSLCKHISLQLRKVARLVTTLADPHVQQVRVYGCVVGLQQPALDGLGCRDKHSYVKILLQGFLL